MPDLTPTARLIAAGESSHQISHLHMGQMIAELDSALQNMHYAAQKLDDKSIASAQMKTAQEIIRHVQYRLGNDGHITQSPALPDDLRDVLDRHGVAATEGAVLAAFEAWGWWVYLSGPERETSLMQHRWNAWASTIPYRRVAGGGWTALIALARAFAELVKEEGATNGNHD